MSAVHEYRRQLGMPVATATHQLRVALLFKLAKLTQPNCFRCGKPLTQKTLSIDHAKPWRNKTKAKRLFFNLKNIMFSHRRCNTMHNHGNTLPEHERKEHRRLKQLGYVQKHRRLHPPKHDARKRRDRYLRTGN